MPPKHRKHATEGRNRAVQGGDTVAQPEHSGEGTVVKVDDQLVDVLGKLFHAIDDIRSQLNGKRKSHYTIDEIAEQVGRAPYTIRTWVKEGRLKAIRVPGTGPKGRLLIAHEELAKLVASGQSGNVPAAVIV